MQAIPSLCLIVFGLSAFASAPCAQEMAEASAHPAANVPPKNLNELARNKGFWPKQVTLKQELKMRRGGDLKAGATLPLYEVRANGVVIDTGKALVSIQKGTTDVLERVSKLVAAMSPEQFALRMVQLPAKEELWPVLVHMKTEMGFQNGVRIVPGEDVVFRGFGKRANEVSLVHKKSGTMFTAGPWETDLLDRARQRLGLPADQREHYFVRAVESALQSTESKPLKGAEFILLYRGRKACTRCSAFAPRLSEFYKRVKVEHPNFELVYISLDNSEADLKAHMADSGLPGIPVQFGKTHHAANATLLEGPKMLPFVHVVDRSGKVLAHTDRYGRKKPDDVLKDFEALLQKAAQSKQSEKSDD